ncbi:MAG: shikimate dehydrogenase [Euryarchaeota archaeon]|nr:shikimate dehydrogenase [Euryarchaeota archaeon]
MTTIYGVLGHPIGHTLSPIMHNAAFDHLSLDARYYAFDVDERHAEAAVHGAQALGFGGLNITIPLKEVVLQYVEADALAQRIGAVNTIDRAGKGWNTDGVGAIRALEHANVKLRDASVVLLGAGGAAKAIAAQLLLKGARVLVVNRTQSRSMLLAQHMTAENLACGCDDIEAYGLDEIHHLLGEADVLINATPVGMQGAFADQTLVTSKQMHRGLVVFDIVYNPLLTPLLKEAHAAGALTIDGVKMLVYQGAASFTIWTGLEPPVAVMEEAVRHALQRLETAHE